MSNARSKFDEALITQKIKLMNRYAKLEARYYNLTKTHKYTNFHPEPEEERKLRKDEEQLRKDEEQLQREQKSKAAEIKEPNWNQLEAFQDDNILRVEEPPDTISERKIPANAMIPQYLERKMDAINDALLCIEEYQKKKLIDQRKNASFLEELNTKLTDAAKKSAEIPHSGIFKFGRSDTTKVLDSTQSIVSKELKKHQTTNTTEKKYKS